MKSKIITASLALQLAFLASSQSAIIYSGLRDIAIPTTLDGIYLDIDTGNTSSAEFSGWDINPFFGGEAVANSQDFQPVRFSTDEESNILNLAPATTVDITSVFADTFAGSGIHHGAGPGFFVSGVEGFIGFQFIPVGETEFAYGWMRLVLNNDGTPGIIRDWAYETSGGSIQVGAIPEPSTAIISFIGLGFLTLFRRR